MQRYFYNIATSAMPKAVSESHAPKDFGVSKAVRLCMGLFSLNTSWIGLIGASLPFAWAPLRAGIAWACSCLTTSFTGCRPAARVLKSMRCSCASTEYSCSLTTAKDSCWGVFEVYGTGETLRAWDSGVGNSQGPHSRKPWLLRGALVAFSPGTSPTDQS